MLFANFGVISSGQDPVLPKQFNFPSYSMYYTNDPTYGVILESTVDNPSYAKVISYDPDTGEATIEAKVRFRGIPSSGSVQVWGGIYCLKKDGTSQLINPIDSVSLSNGLIERTSTLSVNIGMDLTHYSFMTSIWVANLGEGVGRKTLSYVDVLDVYSEI